MSQGRYCACGCGQLIESKPWHKYQPVKYINGHNTKKGRENPHWRGGNGFTTEQGYKRVPNGHYPNGKIVYSYVQRIIAERVWRGPLPEEHVVHHINHRRDDNCLCNLTVVSDGDHKLLHGGEHVSFVTLLNVMIAQEALIGKEAPCTTLHT